MSKEILAFKVNMINSDVLKQIKKLEEDKYIEQFLISSSKQDKVYVIYYNDEMFIKSGRKTTYLKIGNARQVVTEEAKSIASYEHKGRIWCELSNEERNKAIDEVKKRFEIKEFIEGM